MLSSFFDALFMLSAVFCFFDCCGSVYVFHINDVILPNWKKHPTLFRSQVHFSLCHHKTCNVPCFNGLHFVRHEGSMKSVFCNTNVICNDANTEFFIYFILNIASIYKVYILINILSLNFDPTGSWRELYTCAPCGSIPAKVTQDSIATGVAPPRRRE